MNTKSAAALMGRRSPFEAMQSAELDWWRRYCAGQTAVERMYALYGMRYARFWKELETCGRTVEFGSGPMPVLAMARAADGVCVDTLMPLYLEAGLVTRTLRWERNAADVPASVADTALLLNVLDHTDDPEAMVREAYRVLLPGGKVLVFVHLNQVDEKHRLVKDDEPARWLADAGFRLDWWMKVSPTDYDPAAYAGVWVK